MMQPGSWAGTGSGTAASAGTALPCAHSVPEPPQQGAEPLHPCDAPWRPEQSRFATALKRGRAVRGASVRRMGKKGAERLGQQ